MKSIQGKFLTIVISGMLILAFAISAISVLYISKILDADSDTITEAVANTEALRINQKLRDVEYSVETMANYVSSTIGDIEHIKDETYINEYISMAEDAFYAIANESGGTLAFYLCLAPEITDGASGCYFARMSSEGEFEELPNLIPTDLESSPWYHEPKSTGAPVWFTPYYDEFVKTEVVSYVIPLYSEHNFIGIIGIDLEFSVLTEMVKEVSVYDNGFAYLSDEDAENVYYLPVSEHILDKAATHHGFAEEHKLLDNGMTLVIHADYSDIQRSSYNVISIIIVIVIVLIASFVFITFFLTKRIVRPLKMITVAADKLSVGDTDLQLESCHTADEVGVLAQAFEKTAEKLHGYMDYINALAYRDSLTGVKNLTAYNEMTSTLDIKIKTEGKSEPFAILVADINCLKETNDKHGHEIGNRLIIRSAKIICDTFKHSPVFRIGGDEFVVFLRGDDLENYEDLLLNMDEKASQTVIVADSDEITVVIARAVAVFDSTVDFCFADVFNRADKLMYKNKRHLKSLSGSSTEAQ